MSTPAKHTPPALPRRSDEKVPASRQAGGQPPAVAVAGAGSAGHAGGGRERGWSAWRQIVLGFVTLLVLVGGFGAWAVVTSIAGAVIAPGQIEVQQNRQVVQHPDGGVVEAIMTDEGARVEAGQILLRLDGSMLRSELALVESQYFEVLARRGRLTAERDGTEQIMFPDELVRAAAERRDIAAQMEGQRSLLVARNTTLSQQVDQLERRRGQIAGQIEGIDVQAEALETQLRLIGEELATQQSLLDRGLAQAARVLALQREEARLRGSIGGLAAERALAEERITDIALEVLALRSVRREEAQTQLRDLGVRELELVERRRALVERLAQLEIRAPVSGVIYGLQVTTPRAVLRAAEPALYVVPQDRPLVIAARVDPNDINQVYVGQSVTLMFPAFNLRNMPDVTGQVVQVSADAFTDDRSQSSYYRAEIVLDEASVETLGERTLLPGMPVEAFIRTEDRTPMGYLVRPLTDYFSRAFREE